MWLWKHFLCCFTGTPFLLFVVVFVGTFVWRFLLFLQHSSFSGEHLFFPGNRLSRWPFLIWACSPWAATFHFQLKAEWGCPNGVALISSIWPTWSRLCTRFLILYYQFGRPGPDCIIPLISSTWLTWSRLCTIPLISSTWLTWSRLCTIPLISSTWLTWSRLAPYLLYHQFGQPGPDCTSCFLYYQLGWLV